MKSSELCLSALGPEKSATDISSISKKTRLNSSLLKLQIQAVYLRRQRSRCSVISMKCVLHSSILQKAVSDTLKSCLRKSWRRKAKDVIGKLTASLQVRPFEFIRRTDPQASCLTLSRMSIHRLLLLYLSYLPASQASLVVSSLPPEKQADVARRIAQMDRTSPDVIKQVEKVLERKLASLS